MKKVLFLRLILVFCVFLNATFLGAATLQFKDGSVIRDAEVEDILRRFTNPIFKAAGLDPLDVKLFLLADNTVNAVTTPGPMILVNTGLIIRCGRVEELIAVLAHETGHAARKHLVGRLEAFQNATMPYLLSMGLGAIVSILTGTPDGLMLGSALGQQVGTRSFLTFSRTQEMQADFVSHTVLEKLKWPIDGSISLFERLQAFSDIPSTKAVYTQTHPAAHERIQVAKRRCNPLYRLPPDFAPLFDRLRIKILAYMLHPSDILKNPLIQRSPIKEYAFLIAALRQGDLKKAEGLCQKLLKQNPRDAYLYEMAAQIYLEQGALSKAEAAVEKVFQLQARPHMSFYILKARLLMARKKEVMQTRALLQQAILLEPSSPEPWYWLSILAGAQKRSAALYYLAEYNVRLGLFVQAERQVALAKKGLSPKDPLYVHLSDLDMMLKDQRRRMGA